MAKTLNQLWEAVAKGARQWLPPPLGKMGMGASGCK